MFKESNILGPLVYQCAHLYYMGKKAREKNSENKQLFAHICLLDSWGTLSLEAVWTEDCRCALWTAFEEDYSRSEKFFFLFLDIVLNWILNCLRYLTWNKLFFFGPRGKNMELIWFALTLRLICLITRKCLIQNQRNRCYLLNFSTVHIPSSSYHELAIGAAVGHLPVFNVTVLWQYIDISETRCCFSLQAVCMGFFWYSAVHFRQAAS